MSALRILPKFWQTPTEKAQILAIRRLSQARIHAAWAHDLPRSHPSDGHAGLSSRLRPWGWGGWLPCPYLLFCPNFGNTPQKPNSLADFPTPKYTQPGQIKCYAGEFWKKKHGPLKKKKKESKAGPIMNNERLGPSLKYWENIGRCRKLLGLFGT